MLQSQRQQEIYEYLQVKKSASVALLCERFYASGATIRRDLCALEHKGLIRRTHGGAVLYEGGNDELSVTIREQSAVPQKRIIGELASYFLKDSYRVFLDSSSTAGYMLPYLRGVKNLSVITNGLRSAMLLSQAGAHEVYLPGGRLLERSNSLVGSDTLQSLDSYCADVAFFSCSGLDPRFGITEANPEQAQVKRRMLKRAKTKILLCDSTKFYRSFLYQTCGFGDVDYLITDQRPGEDILALLEGTACDLVCPQL
ncbi:DeoR/GlpR family DNA-binding transcription regulator [Harryflintia acetispora]|uniref:DeoR family transcriptional regulator n=1 Tax=Harryflintia acetispora TaxID=1849041 RepID=A0A9X8Y7J4_9FIRM|nr:DeoR/GlpR family DNA-binding transcription regulator [Harryflintia acetispora]TCL42405.1 DeoR family transcriptional regulator [Harryflintia acetispora]